MWSLNKVWNINSLVLVLFINIRALGILLYRTCTIEQHSTEHLVPLIYYFTYIQQGLGQVILEVLESNTSSFHIGNYKFKYFKYLKGIRYITNFSIEYKYNYQVLYQFGHKQ